MILVLDTAAVSDLIAGGPTVERVAAASADGHRTIIPTVVLAELATGKATDAELWRVLKRIPCEDSTPHSAMRAGALRERAEAVRRKKRDLTVDALVASLAVDFAPAILTTIDTEDMRLLTVGADVKVVPITQPE
jgi:predicted nucleic acid-binding protein